MVYVYYFASFIVLLREVLRPGVLWFLRNLNDPDFSPIQVSKLVKLTNVSNYGVSVTHVSKYKNRRNRQQRSKICLCRK